VRDGTSLVTQRPLVIDVGAAGKGYLVDILSGMIAHAGLDRFVVDASGDLRHVGPRPLRIGLEHPFDAKQVIGVANLRSWTQNLCGRLRTPACGAESPLLPRFGFRVWRVHRTRATCAEAFFYLVSGSDIPR
jgi:hypothetical protein